MDLPLTFRLCCLKRSDKKGKKNREVTYHFHESDGISHNRRPETGECTIGDTGHKVYDPLELAIEGAKAKVIKDDARFKKIRQLLMDHRSKIENELKKISKG